MYNVLPDDHKKEIKQEYSLRLFTVILFLVSGIVLCGIITLIPEISLTLLKKASLTQDLSEFKEGNKGQLRGTYTDSIRQIDRQVEVLNMIGKVTSPHEIIEKIIKNRGVGIKLTKFSYEIVGTTTPVTLEGSASRLDNLLNFQNTMQSTSPFTTAEFPIEILSKPKNSAVGFNMQLR